MRRRSKNCDTHVFKRQTMWAKRCGCHDFFVPDTDDASAYSSVIGISAQEHEEAMRGIERAMRRETRRHNRVSVSCAVRNIASLGRISIGTYGLGPSTSHTTNRARPRPSRPSAGPGIGTGISGSHRMRRCRFPREPQTPLSGRVFPMSGT